MAGPYAQSRGKMGRMNFEPGWLGELDAAA